MTTNHLVFNVSDYYVPYFSVCLISLLENINKDTLYRITILEQDISEANKEELLRLIPDNVPLDFVNIKSKIASTSFIPHSHVSVETFFKLFIPILFKNEPVVLFCDADIIFNKDPAELFSLKLGENKLAAAPCLLWRGIINRDKASHDYTVNELKISDTNQYFQCGVLIFNNHAIAPCDIDKTLSIAQSREFVCMDQDILNHCFYRKVLLLDNRRNYETAQKGFAQLSIPFMDEETKTSYLRAKAEPYIIHYSGAEKPWLYPNEEYADMWWKHARKSPWYSQLLCRLDAFQLIDGEIRRFRDEFRTIHFPNINSRFSGNERERKLLFVMGHLWAFRLRKLRYKILSGFASGERHEKYYAKYRALKELIKDALVLKKKLFSP